MASRVAEADDQGRGGGEDDRDTGGQQGGGEQGGRADRPGAPACAGRVQAAGGTIRTGWRLAEMRSRPSHLELVSAMEESIECDYLVTCAGLHADRVAALCGRPAATARGT